MNNNFNYTDLAFNNTWEYELYTVSDDKEEYCESSTLNFFGVCSNLSYSNLDIQSYEN